MRLSFPTPTINTTIVMGMYRVLVVDICDTGNIEGEALGPPN